MLNFDANIDYTEVTPTTPTGRQRELEEGGRRGRGEQEAACGWDHNKSTFGRQSVSRKLKHFTRPDVDKLEPSLGSRLSVVRRSVVQCSGCSGSPGPSAPVTCRILSIHLQFTNAPVQFQFRPLRRGRNFTVPAVEASPDYRLNK